MILDLPNKRITIIRHSQFILPLLRAKEFHFNTIIGRVKVKIQIT